MSQERCLVCCSPAMDCSCMSCWTLQRVVARTTDALRSLLENSGDYPQEIVLRAAIKAELKSRGENYV
jgi:hypothetical protein